MWPDRVLNTGPLALESDALPTALRGPASRRLMKALNLKCYIYGKPRLSVNFNFYRRNKSCK